MLATSARDVSAPRVQPAASAHASPATSRIAIIGDIGGHARALTDALVGLGVHPQTWHLPPDLVVIQVGDLVHRGPDSAGVLHIIDLIMSSQPAQWRQLMGNHESCYLYQDLFVHERLPAASRAMLRRWHQAGLVGMGAGITTEVGPTLVSHAGLTYELWVELGRPATPQDTCDALALAPKAALRPGRMLADTHTSGGVVWAEAGRELYASWLRAEHNGERAPYHQVHGHSSAYRWNRGIYDAPSDVAARLRTDHSRRHVLGTFAGATFTGIDPGFGMDQHSRWAPLVLTGTVNTTGPPPSSPA